MQTEKYKLNNPAFHEFVYSVLYNASVESKRVIPLRLAKFIRNEAEAKKFIRRASMDEAAALLAYMGIGNFHVFYDQKTTTVKDFKEILLKFRQHNKIGSLKDLVEKSIFVTSDKELISLLSLSAQTIHHKAYTMNMEYKRLGYHLHGWSKQLKDHEGDDTQEVQEKSRLLIKTLLSASLTLDKVDFLFGLRPLDMQILWYCYPLKHTYVPVIQINHFFAGHYTKREIAHSIRTLANAQFLQLSALTVQREYTPTNMGVRVVEQFMETVLQANHFQ
jgi:hypothetical protein